MSAGAATPLESGHGPLDQLEPTSEALAREPVPEALLADVKLQLKLD